jgi:cold-inducible RNA-binding protein
MESRLFVGNLSYHTTAEQLREVFSQAGTLKEVNLVTERETGRSKGFGFVQMDTPSEAQKAIEMFNGYVLDDRALTVTLARPREERSSSGARSTAPYDDRSRGSHRGYDAVSRDRY